MVTLFAFLSETRSISQISLHFVQNVFASFRIISEETVETGQPGQVSLTDQPGQVSLDRWPEHKRKDMTWEQDNQRDRTGKLVQWQDSLSV
jgi:hypothetical protein